MRSPTHPPTHPQLTLRLEQHSDSIVALRSTPYGCMTKIGCCTLPAETSAGLRFFISAHGGKGEENCASFRDVCAFDIAEDRVSL